MSLDRSYSRELKVDIFECRFLGKTINFGIKKKILPK
jgi:hypothetical protein